MIFRFSFKFLYFSSPYLQFVLYFTFTLQNYSTCTLTLQSAVFFFLIASIYDIFRQDIDEKQLINESRQTSVILLYSYTTIFFVPPLFVCVCIPCHLLFPSSKRFKITTLSEKKNPPSTKPLPVPAALPCETPSPSSTPSLASACLSPSVSTLSRS